MYALVSTGYPFFVCDPFVDLTICLSLDRPCQCVGHRQIFIIPLPVSCLCTTFEAVSVDREVVIDAQSAAATAAIDPLLIIFFSDKITLVNFYL